MNIKFIFTFIAIIIPWQLVHAVEIQHKPFAGISFVRIEAGCFLMGRDTEVKESSEVELPQHRVCIEKPFYLSETEITQKQWETVMGSNPSKYKGQYKPVEKVNWNDTQDFIKRLNDQEGGSFFRLPSEAEWEYAARAGSTTLYSFGDKPKDLVDYAWFGNVRELENVMERAIVLSAGKVIAIKHLSKEIVGEIQAQPVVHVVEISALNSQVEQFEKNIIEQALLKTGDNKAKAAQLLEISERSLWYKVKKYF